MTVIYFTNNANNGTGSLRAAIAAASPGDVIRPDETVFERGSTIEIALASALTIGKNLTLDASPCRIRLDAGGAFRCAHIPAGVAATFTAFDFVNGYNEMTAGCVHSQGMLTLNRCGVYGGSATFGGGVYVSDLSQINDCVITGCRATNFGGGIVAAKGVILNGSTVVGNVAGMSERRDVQSTAGVLTARNSIVGGVYAPGGKEYSESVVGVASSTIGFVASPPDDLTIDNWNADAWKNWDLRLLDDASPNPSPYRDSGDVGEMSQCDFDGFLRGRKANNIATCSPGAYETLQADLFWVGRDSHGFPVASPMWTTSSGWSVSRFSKTSGNIVPKYGDIVLINNELTVVPKYKDVVGNVIYFTNNAGSGNGSLHAAIESAQPGDIIRPDETVFERGSTIEISLASPLIFNKNLTLDASPSRIRLDAGGAFRCALVSPGVNTEIQGVEFISGKTGDAGGGVTVSRWASAFFRRCVFAGCQGSAGGGLYCSSETEVQLCECVATGCCATSGNGGGVASSGRLIVSGSTIYGNVASGVGSDLRSTNETVVVNSLIGFVSANLGDAPGSVVGVAASTIGFVASPPDDLTVENWDATLWQNWDLHLLDDASLNPSPYRDSGDVGEMSQYDLQGNFRRRKTNDVETCSPGAYETIQADLFWVGKPFPQEMVDAAPQNIRVANYRQTTGSNLYEADMTWEIPDGVSYSSIYGQYSSDGGASWKYLGYVAANATSCNAYSITPGKEYLVRLRGAFTDGSYTAWSVIIYSSPLELDGSNGEQRWALQLPSELSVVNPSFLTSDGWAASRFATVSGDVAPQVGQALFIGRDVAFNAPPSGRIGVLTVGGGTVLSVGGGTTTVSDLVAGIGAVLQGSTINGYRARLGDYFRAETNVFYSFTLTEVGASVYIRNHAAYSTVVSTAPTYGTLQLLPSSNGRPTLSGNYVCADFRVRANSSVNVLPVAVSGSATVRSTLFSLGTDATSQYLERFFDGPVTLELQGDATVGVPLPTRETWTDNFTVDVSEATSATLTLSGQTVYGDAPTAAVELVGSAKVGKGGFNVALLTLNDNAVLAIEDKNFSAESINLSASSVLNINDTWIYVPNLVADDNATINFSGVDAILTVTEGATIGAVNFTGTGYFVSPQDADLTSATLAETVRHVDYFAGVTNFIATAVGATNAMLTWVATDETLNICIERENRSKPEGWEIVALTTSVESPLNVALSGRERFRIFDGSNFLYDDAYFTVKSFYVYSISSTQKDVESLALYSKKTQIIRAHMEGTRNENILLLAQIKNLLTGEFLSTTNVDNIKASVYKINKSISSGDIWEAQDEWTEVVVEKEAILEEPVMIDGWTNDDTGANFIWTPDTRNKSLFKDGGRYVIQVTFNLINDNPIVISFNVNVK